MIPIGVFGLSGRMGQVLWKNAPIHNCRVIWGTYHQQIPENTFEGVSWEKSSSHFWTIKTVEQLKKLGIKGFLDFSNKSVVRMNAQLAVDLGLPYVCGVTGLQEEDFHFLKELSSRIPILHSPNFSIFIALVVRFLRQLPDHFLHEVNISEWHHRHKKDKPSGTALLLYNQIQAKVKSSTLPIKSYRVGEIFGIHKLQLELPQESLIITHKAHGRDVFANGALKALIWLIKQPPGYYDFFDEVDRWLENR